MKLFHRVLLHLLTAIGVILTIWALFFYVAISEEINDEVDDSLEDYSELIIIRSLAGESLPSHDSGSNNQYYLRKVDETYAQSHPHICFSDSMIYIVEKGETEPARILITLFQDSNKQYHELTVYTPTIEKSDLRESILQLIILLYVALFITILLINIWVFRRSMKPFYILIQWLESNRLGRKHSPIVNPTHTTEFSKLSNALNAYATHSEEVYEQQKQFIGNASHEIQTPLAVCQGRIEMLLDDDSLTENQMEELAKTHQTLEYVTRLNKSLLLLCKIDNSQFIERSKIEINQLTHQFLADYKEVYAYRHITSLVEEQGEFSLYMNETLASILITNLIKNAFVHNVDNGKINIHINSKEFIIQNSGTPQSLDANHIFDRFYQGDKHEGSVGLGLAIVQSICKQCNINIEYRFTEGLHTFVLHTS